MSEVPGIGARILRRHRSMLFDLDRRRIGVMEDRSDEVVDREKYRFGVPKWKEKSGMKISLIYPMHKPITPTLHDSSIPDDIHSGRATGL